MCIRDSVRPSRGLPAGTPGPRGGLRESPYQGARWPEIGVDDSDHEPPQLHEPALAALLGEYGVEGGLTGLQQRVVLRHAVVLPQHSPLGNPSVRASDEAARLVEDRDLKVGRRETGVTQEEPGPRLARALRPRVAQGEGPPRLVSTRTAPDHLEGLCQVFCRTELAVKRRIARRDRSTPAGGPCQVDETARHGGDGDVVDRRTELRFQAGDMYLPPGAMAIPSTPGADT